MTEALKAVQLTKTYGSVTAIADVDLTLAFGEILAVVGDNGAGKSTLMACLAGATQPDHGEIWLDGRRMHFRNTIDARRAGIEIVYQSLALAPAQDVVSNMFLSRERRRRGVLGTVFRLLDDQAMELEANRHLEDLGLHPVQDLRQRVATLSGCQRQAIAVARAVAFGGKVIIFDEPTAALGVHASQVVLGVMKRLRDRGLGVILVSHNMQDVFAVADRIAIQRLGRCEAVVDTQSCRPDEVERIMSGG